MTGRLCRAARTSGLRAAPDDAAEQVSQLLLGERVRVCEAGADGWVRVVAPDQPGGGGPDGYPGWVRRSDLVDSPLAFARGLVGTPYLWGGLTAAGIDCSGLVHLSFRIFGLVVPRDAADQAAAADPVAPGQERPGDLWFFARAGARIHHVAFVAGPGWLLHAPDSGPVRHVVEQALPPERAATLVAVGRFGRG